jgi:hypothetical protein
MQPLPFGARFYLNLSNSERSLIAARLIYNQSEGTNFNLFFLYLQLCRIPLRFLEEDPASSMLSNKAQERRCKVFDLLKLHTLSPAVSAPLRIRSFIMAVILVEPRTPFAM